MWKVFDGICSEWDSLLSENHSLQQYSFWGINKVNDGWETLRLIKYAKSGYVDACVQALIKIKYNVAVVWVAGCPPELIPNIDKTFYKILIKSTGCIYVYCRISVMDEEHGNEETLLKSLHWGKPSFIINSGLSMLLDLNGGVDEIQKKMSKNWRHNLKRSNKYSLTFERWDKPDPQELYMIYQEMEVYKGIKEQYSFSQIESIIKNLGNNLILYRCLDKNKDLLAFRGIGVYGGSCLDMFAAATTKARKVYATYGLLWTIVQYCCENEILHYDLGGIDPVANPGVYNFKKGTGATKVKYIGEWEWANVPFLKYVANKAIRYRGVVK
jgi:lipid II:glycine glycyltransferase (peptidoglycan interpeptide bridge formation enzyme)